VTPGSIITRDTFTAANLKAIDTHGILGGEAGAETTGQGLIDALTNKLLTEFVTNTVLMERLGTYVLKSKIVNDFLSTDEETVLSGPMGKLLKEQLNVLNTKKAEKQWEYIGNSFNDVTFAPNKYSEIYVCAFIDDDNSKMIPFLLPLETIKHGPDNSITNPRFAGASLYNGWALLHYNDGLIRMQSSSAGSTSIYVYGR
jgi:putative uncharacterized protein (fragment)